MTNNINKASLATQAIHDESNSSVGDNGNMILDKDSAEVHRQIEITREQYSKKIKKLKEIIRKSTKGKLKNNRIFTYCKEGEPKLDRYDCAFYTDKKAVLKISVRKYNGDKFYLGTQGSPVKILTGQNVVEHSEELRVTALAKTLKCTKFEARSIFGFYMLRDCVQEELGEPLFTEEEETDINNRNISVYSIGFATYMDLGEDRDQKFHTLCAMAGYASYYKETNVPLAAHLGVSVKCFPEHGSHPTKHQYQSLLIQKKIGGSLSVTQMMYLKDLEVLQKDDHSGKENSRVIQEVLTPQQKRELRTMVRIDNVFFRSYIRQWLRWLSKIEGYEDIEVPPDDRAFLSLAEVAPLFDNTQLVLDMSRLMLNELNLIPRITCSPTLRRINALIYSVNTKNRISDEHRELCRLWHAETRATKVVNNTVELKIKKDSDRKSVV